jgi:hypothetical protein
MIKKLLFCGPLICSLERAVILMQEAEQEVGGAGRHVDNVGGSAAEGVVGFEEF